MCDLIKFKPNLFTSDWMLAKGKYSYDKRSVWTKGVFSFLSDGWHCFDSVRNMSFIILVVIALGLPIYYSILGYALYGGAELVARYKWSGNASSLLNDSGVIEGTYIEGLGNGLTGTNIDITDQVKVGAKYK